MILQFLRNPKCFMPTKTTNLTVYTYYVVSSLEHKDKILIYKVHR